MYVITWALRLISELLPEPFCILKPSQQTNRFGSLYSYKYKSLAISEGGILQLFVQEIYMYVR